MLSKNFKRTRAYANGQEFGSINSHSEPSSMMALLSLITLSVSASPRPQALPPKGSYTDSLCSVYLSQKCGYSFPSGTISIGGDMPSCKKNRNPTGTDCQWNIDRPVPVHWWQGMAQAWYVPKCPLVVLPTGVKKYFCPPTTSNP